MRGIKKLFILAILTIVLLYYYGAFSFEYGFPSYELNESTLELLFLKDVRILQITDDFYFISFKTINNLYAGFANSNSASDMKLIATLLNNGYQSLSILPFIFYVIAALVILLKKQNIPEQNLAPAGLLNFFIYFTNKLQPKRRVQIINYNAVTCISYGLKEKPRLQTASLSDVEFACKYAFKLFGRQAQVELPTYGYGYAPGLFRHDDGYRVAVLRYAHGGTVAQPEFLGDVEVVAYRQNAAGGAYPVL